MKKLDVSSLQYNRWNFENFLIMSWLINFMQSHIARTYLLLNTVENIWNATSLTYSQVKNDVQIYELRRGSQYKIRRNNYVSIFFCTQWTMIGVRLLSTFSNKLPWRCSQILETDRKRANL